MITLELHSNSPYYQGFTAPRTTAKVKGPVLVICFYQLIEGRLVAWWVYVDA